MHGGLLPSVVIKARERYIMWCLADEPFLNPKYFDRFMTLWVKMLTDQIMKVPVNTQIKLLEIAVELIRHEHRLAETGEIEDV
jgi:hypothetical protein